MYLDTNTNATFQHRSQSPDINGPHVQWNHTGLTSLLSPPPTSNAITNSFAHRKPLNSGIGKFIPPSPHPRQGLRHLRLFSTSRAFLAENHDGKDQPSPTNNLNGQEQQPKLTHLTPTGEAHMVSITSKTPSSRTAVARCAVYFSNPTPYPLVITNSLKKGDVLGVARIAGIMAAKRTPDIIPLCHPIMLTHAEVELVPVGPPAVQEGLDGATPPKEYGYIDIKATVSCYGKTGVEMEAMTAASAAALTVYDMCKAVDKGMRVEGLRVVMKEGGKSGTWVEGERAKE